MRYQSLLTVTGAVLALLTFNTGFAYQHSKPMGASYHHHPVVHQRANDHYRSMPEHHEITYPKYRPILKTISRNSYRTIKGRTMRLYNSTTYCVLESGATCYINNVGFGFVTGTECCLYGKCYKQFYVD